jgi:hypothetical protein
VPNRLGMARHGLVTRPVLDCLVRYPESEGRLDATIYADRRATAQVRGHHRGWIEACLDAAHEGSAREWPDERKPSPELRCIERIRLAPTIFGEGYQPRHRYDTRRGRSPTVPPSLTQRSAY